MLREAVAAINLADKPGSAFALGADAALGDENVAQALPPSLLDGDDLATLEIVGTLRSPVSRTRARLSLLRGALERHRRPAAGKPGAAKRGDDANQ